VLHTTASFQSIASLLRPVTLLRPVPLLQLPITGKVRLVLVLVLLMIVPERLRLWMWLTVLNQWLGQLQLRRYCCWAIPIGPMDLFGSRLRLLHGWRMWRWWSWCCGPARHAALLVNRAVALVVAVLAARAAMFAVV
jgi:hypothetical protein